MKRYGCKYGLPHDMRILHENPKVKWEVCHICNKKFRWNKGYKSRIDNTRYLEAHARNFAQSTGPTRGLYMRIYKPKKSVIVL